MIVGISGVCKKYTRPKVSRNILPPGPDGCEYTNEAECIIDELCAWIPHGMIYQCWIISQSFWSLNYNFIWCIYIISGRMQYNYSIFVFWNTDICKITHHGGCKQWVNKNLKMKGGFHLNREYTVDECYALCKKEPECGGFFRTKDSERGKSKGSCLLYRKGCTNDGNPNFEYYALADCQTNSNLLIHFAVFWNPYCHYYNSIYIKKDTPYYSTIM